MLDAAQTILLHVKNKKQTDMEEDRLLIGGIIRELLLIGEAANAISPGLKEKITSIPWRKVIGMRNQLIHGYYEVNHKIIWMTIIDDIPNLILELRKILENTNKN